MTSLYSVSFSYGDHLVLQNVSMTLSVGQRTALMAPSGSGKTTLLRLLAGLEQPSSGTVEGIPALGVSMVFQEDRLLPQLTVLGNLVLAAPHANRNVLLAMLDELSLAPVANSYPGTLSGGMKRRVAIARAIAFGSPLVLLDEPFSGLDEHTRAQTATFILRHTQNCALLAVTHDQQEAALLDAKIIVLPTQPVGAPQQLTHGS